MVQIPTTRQDHYIIHKYSSSGDSQNVIATYDGIFSTTLKYFYYCIVK